MIYPKTHLRGSSDPAASVSARALTFTWLVRLRWGSVIAESATVVLALVVLHVPLATASLAAIIAVTALSNLALDLWRRAERPFASPAIGAVLLADTALLTTLLYFSGGPWNPFTSLYLLYVMLAALALGMRWASAVVVVGGGRIRPALLRARPGRRARARAPRGGRPVDAPESHVGGFCRHGDSRRLLRIARRSRLARARGAARASPAHRRSKRQARVPEHPRCRRRPRAWDAAVDDRRSGKGARARAGASRASAARRTRASSVAPSSAAAASSCR